MKKGLIASFMVALMLVTVLSAGLSANAISSSDDTTPPVTTISFDPPEPDGWNDWYISDVNVTLNATDDMSGVKEIHYRVNESEWKVHNGNFLIFILDYDCLKNGSIEFYSVDNVGNEEEIKIVEGIYIDQLPPYSNLWYEVMGGNPKDGWLIEITTTNITDDCSGFTGRVTFYINGVEQCVVVGPGPTYKWSFVYHGGLKITIGVGYCDWAGNCVIDEIQIKFIRKSIQQSTHPLFLRFLERFPILNLLLQRMV